jgi:hypothetical protein
MWPFILLRVLQYKLENWNQNHYPQNKLRNKKKNMKDFREA